MQKEEERVLTSGPGSWSGKMSPEHSAPTKERISKPSLKKRSASSAKKPPLFLYLKTDGQQPDVCMEWGGDWSVAWRVLDAQFWGVPQRRRRIALVADFGGSTAPEILFERESVSGDSSPCGTPWEGITPDAQGCVGITNRGIVSGGVSETLRAESHGALPMVATRSDDGDTDAIHPAICIQGNCIDRADTAGCNGKGWRDDDISFTLNTVDRPAVYDARGNGDGVVVPTITGDHESRVTDYTAVCIGNGQADIASHITEDVAQTLNCMHDQQAVMMYMSMQAIGEYRESDVASSCKQRDYKDATDLICAVDCRNGTENPDTNGTLQSKPDGGMSLNLQNVVREHSIVRRLTPLECERLQGFPDGWTDIGEWTDSKGKVHKECADTARYKALGNSIALPPWLYVLQKLSLSCGTDCTMASLFDGIGGFPLLWEHLNGRGTCLWASEIEEFPIAVTKYHFPEVGGNYGK